MQTTLDRVAVRPWQEAGASGETAVVAAAVDGDVDAFARLYDRYVERVFRYVHYRIGRRGEAEDVTQQVFLEAFRSIRRYRDTGAPFAAWLLTIAHYVLVDHLRKFRPTGQLDVDHETRERWASPESSALALDDQLAVRRAILALKSEHQQVVTLRSIEGLSYAEIAAAIGKSEVAVRVIHHRALKQMRAMLEAEGWR